MQLHHLEVSPAGLLKGYDGNHIPPHLQSLINYTQREFDAVCFQRDAHDLAWYQPGELESLADDISLDMSRRADRRSLELALADKLEMCGSLLDSDVWKLSASMRLCRQQGVIGVVPGREGYQVAWSHKCGSVRLCPDEAREEAQRLDNKYREAIQDWLSASRTRSVHYSVFTLHNFRPGDLARGKKYIFEKFKPIFDQFPSIKGAVVSEEDPLSKHNDWNLHLNVLFLVEGSLDYGAVRAWWGSNIHFQLVKHEKIGDSLRELIKYSVKHQSDSDSEAPGLLDWTPVEFQEWFRAQKGFRRTRVYGCLYKLHSKRWDCQELSGDVRHDRRVQWWQAGATRWPLLSYDVVKHPWNDLSVKEKAVLCRAMDDGPSLAGQVQWIGRVSYKFGWGENYEGGKYRVDLIPGDNFYGSQRKNNFQSGAPPGVPLQ